MDAIAIKPNVQLNLIQYRMDQCLHYHANSHTKDSTNGRAQSTHIQYRTDGSTRMDLLTIIHTLTHSKIQEMNAHIVKK